MEKKQLNSLVYGQCLIYVILKLRQLRYCKDMHMDKDALVLLRALKVLIFVFGQEREYKLSLVNTDDKFSHVYLG
jgi:hypothetical protein